MSISDEICFPKSSFNFSSIILLCSILFGLYYIFQLKDKFSILQLSEQQCKSDLSSSQENTTTTIITQEPTTQQLFLDKIRNPLSPPENVYPNGTLTSRGYDGYNEYQMVGFVSSETDQFPVFGRFHFPRRSDKYDYYTINESRNRIKIPFKTKNYDELYDNDTVDIPGIGTGLKFTKYETTGLRYNP